MLSILSILCISCASNKTASTGDPYQDTYKGKKSSKYFTSLGGFFLSGGTLVAVRGNSELDRDLGSAIIATGGAFFLLGSRTNDSDRELLDNIKEQSNQKSDTIYIQQSTGDDILSRLANLEKSNVDVEKRANEIDESLHQYIHLTDSELSGINSSLQKIKRSSSKVITQPRVQPNVKKPIEQPIAPSVTPQSKQTISPVTPNRYRTVQFVATVSGKSYTQLEYLGDIITEQVPGKSIVRYKIGGNFSDADIKRVISQLSDHGFKESYEN